MCECVCVSVEREREAVRSLHTQEHQLFIGGSDKQTDILILVLSSGCTHQYPSGSKSQGSESSDSGPTLRIWSSSSQQSQS